MKVKFLVSFMLFTSSQVKAVCTPEAKNIPVREKGSHLGTRTSEPSITASLEQGLLTVNVNHYIGIAKIYVYDYSGNLFVSSSVFVDGNGACSLNLSALECGSNEMVIKLGDIIYWGILDMDKNLW